MIVLTNCLKKDADEGCLKIAVSLVKRLKAADPSVTVIGYERRSDLCDSFLELNKWMRSHALRKLLREKDQPVLFAPFSARMYSTAIRTWMLSRQNRGRVSLLMPMHAPMGFFSKLLMKLSKAKLICHAESSYRYYRERLGDQVICLKTGVDTEKFHPVQPEEKKRLREKYNIPTNKQVVLHVGHLKSCRNIQRMLELEPCFHGVAVVSTHTPDEQDRDLGQQLQNAGITLIHTYLPEIQQIYQLADVYLFPVTAANGCIDIPLSAIEAAACGLPVVTTAFGEMQTLLQQEGFYELIGEDPVQLNSQLKKACLEGKNPREHILNYDWNRTVAGLLSQGINRRNEHS